MSKTALVAGSTGLVGRQLVRILAESTEYDAVIALVRKGSNFIHDGVFTVEADYQNLSTYAEELKADDVFCCLGTTMKKAGSRENFYMVDFTYPYELARIAEKNESEKFSIITASGASVESMFYYSRVKGDIEKALTKLKIPTLNIFRPSLLLGDREEKRTGERIAAAVSKVLNPVMVGRLRRYRSIKASVVARAMFNVSQRQQEGIHIYESSRIQVIGQE